MFAGDCIIEGVNHLHVGIDVSGRVHSGTDAAGLAPEIDKTKRNRNVGAFGDVIEARPPMAP